MVLPTLKSFIRKDGGTQETEVLGLVLLTAGCVTLHCISKHSFQGLSFAYPENDFHMQYDFKGPCQSGILCIYNS